MSLDIEIKVTCKAGTCKVGSATPEPEPLPCSNRDKKVPIQPASMERKLHSPSPNLHTQPIPLVCRENPGGEQRESYLGGGNTTLFGRELGGNFCPCTFCNSSSKKHGWNSPAMEMPYVLSPPRRGLRKSPPGLPLTCQPGSQVIPAGGRAQSCFGFSHIAFIYVLVWGGRTTREGDEGGTRQREEGRAT